MFLCTYLFCFCYVHVCKRVCVCVCLRVSSQILKVPIINVEEYEKQENFFIVLEDPKWLKRGLSGKRVANTCCRDSRHEGGLFSLAE